MQSSLDVFVLKKKGNLQQKRNDKDRHDSSMENSQTEPLESKQQKIPKQSIQYNRKALTCIPFFLLCPSDSIHFNKIEEGLNRLKKSYNPSNRSSFYKYIENNLFYNEKKFNTQNLRLIDDEIFWKQTLPKMINYFLDNHKQISGIRTLSSTKNNNSKVFLTRGQVLTVMISLFFGIMPKNPLTKTRSFGQFTTKIAGQNNPEVRLQKLKFLINYFNIAMQKILHQGKESNFQFETITFQKHVSKTIEIRNDLNPQKKDGRDPPLMDVEFVEDEKTKIEDFYGRAAMVDFANSSIGGGALRKGCVQEEILFLIYPEAFVSIFLVPEMKDNEAVAIYGLRKYSNYKNYSYKVKFDGAYENDELKEVNESVMIAIDATNLNQNHNQDYQYSKQNTLRQIAKAITGFNTISQSGFNELSDLKICTGRWGCGAFGGDQIWKFFIQWISCSYAYRNMIYTSDQQQTLLLIKNTVQRLVKKGKTVLDLFAIMDEFMKVKRRFSKPPQDQNFIDFIKSQYVL